MISELSEIISESSELNREPSEKALKAPANPNEPPEGPPEAPPTSLEGVNVAEAPGRGASAPSKRVSEGAELAPEASFHIGVQAENIDEPTAKPSARSRGEAKSPISRVIRNSG